MYDLYNSYVAIREIQNLQLITKGIRNWVILLLDIICILTQSSSIIKRSRRYAKLKDIEEEADFDNRLRIISKKNELIKKYTETLDDRYKKEIEKLDDFYHVYYDNTTSKEIPEIRLNVLNYDNKQEQEPQMKIS